VIKQIPKSISKIFLGAILISFFVSGCGGGGDDSGLSEDDASLTLGVEVNPGDLPVSDGGGLANPSAPGSSLPGSGNLGVVPSGVLAVFPGAEGFGTETPAGRSGQIIKVTNLNDSGAGSLRAAVQNSGPRIIVFEVGGQIKLSSNLVISNPFITIAGQTAPEPGIMITGRGVEVQTNNVLMQHLRIRPGDNGTLDDCVSLNSGASYNVVLDHISAQWAPDEQISTWIGARNITILNSIIAEGLGERHGLLIGDDVLDLTAKGNLIAHNNERSILAKGGTRFVVANNLIYNPAAWEFFPLTSDSQSSTPVIVGSVVNNIFKNGPSTTAYAGLAISNSIANTSKVYAQGNARWPGGTVFMDKSPAVGVGQSPIDLSGYQFETDLSRLELSVLNSAGARPAYRDAVDARIVQDARLGTGRVPTSQPAYPVYAASYRAFQVPVNPNGDDNRDGYTNIEEVLHQMAAIVEGR